MNKKFTHSGNLILAGFVLIIFFMSFLFYRMWTQKFEMVTDNYYEKEVAFQGQIDAAKNSEAYGSAFSMKVKGAEILLNIPAELSTSLQAGEVYFYCPASQNSDKHIPLQGNTTGQYNFDATAWKKTAYVAKVKFSSGNKQYYKEFDVKL